MEKLMCSFYGSMWKYYLLLIIFLLFGFKSEYIGQGYEEKITLNGEDILAIRGLSERQYTYSFLDPWYDYPKPYSRELVIKKGIRTIEFYSRSVSINQENLFKDLAKDNNLRTIKFSYTYNKNGDLTNFSQYKIQQNIPISIIQCQLIKNYDLNGKLQSWKWIAPQVDSMAENYYSHLSTHIEKELGGVHKRGYIQRNSKGQEIAQMLVLIEPKYVNSKEYKPGRSKFKGFERSYWLKTTTYDGNNKKLAETFFFPSSDSSSLLEKYVPWRFINYKYFKNQHLKEIIESHNFLSSSRDKNWDIAITNFSNKYPNRIEKKETYRVYVAVEDSAQAYPLLQNGSLLISNKNDQLHPAIAVYHFLLLKENYFYDEQSRIIMYTEMDYIFDEPSITLRKYKKDIIIEKRILPDDNYYLVKRYRKGFLQNEFYATGFIDEKSPIISQFFKKPRVNNAPGGYKNQVAKANFNYRNKLLNSVNYNFKNCSNKNCYAVSTPFSVQFKSRLFKNHLLPLL